MRYHCNSVVERAVMPSIGWSHVPLRTSRCIICQCKYKTWSKSIETAFLPQMNHTARGCDHDGRVVTRDCMSRGVYSSFRE